jgi:hypothetical protein
MSFEVYQDRSDGPVLVGTTETLARATALIAAQPHALALDDTSQVLCTSDPTQLVFLASVLEDAGLRLVTAWEPQTDAVDGAIGIFERIVIGEGS